MRPLAWLVLVLCISVEFSMTIWASDLLKDRVGMGGEKFAERLFMESVTIEER